MATTRQMNGLSYQIPDQGDSYLWGTDLSGWVAGASTGTLQKTAGLFALSAEVDFGSSFGIKAAYLSSRTNAASAGLLRLANSDTIKFRNAANSADNTLSMVGDVLTYSGAFVATSATFSGGMTGNASTATALQTPRAINGVNFDGTAPITIPAVDTATPRVAKAGDTMTGTLTMNTTEFMRGNFSSGYLSAYDTTGTVRSGYIQWNVGATGMTLGSEASGPMTFTTNHSKMTLLNNNGSGELVVGDQTVASFASSARANLTVGCVAGDAIIGFGTIGGGNSGYIYHSGSAMEMRNAIAGGPISFNVANSGGGDITLTGNGRVGIGGAPFGTGAKFAVNGDYATIGNGTYRGYWGRGDSLSSTGATTDYGMYCDTGDIFLSRVVSGTATTVLRSKSDGFLYGQEGIELGYKTLPNRGGVIHGAGNYTAVLADKGHMIQCNAGCNLIIPAGVFSHGDVLNFVNWDSGNTMTLTQGSGLTLYWSGPSTATTGNRGLAKIASGMIWFSDANNGFITGAGLT